MTSSTSIGTIGAKQEFKPRTTPSHNYTRPQNDHTIIHENKEHAAADATTGNNKATTDFRCATQLYEGLKHKYPWRVYLTGFFHLTVYVAVFFISYLRCIYNKNSVIWSIPLGWSIYAIWMIGHESYHQAMLPSSPANYRDMNEWLGYFTMDCISVSRHGWKISHHELHHRHPLSTHPVLGEDHQKLKGRNILLETLYTLRLATLYWREDLRDFWNSPTVSKTIALCIRFGFLLILPLNALLGAMISVAIFGNYLSALTHAIPYIRTSRASAGKEKNTISPYEKGVVYQLRTSLDILPQSQFFLFLTGGFNCHSTHHVYPSLPRSLHPQFSRRLQGLMPDEYRTIDNVRTLGVLWLLRNKGNELIALEKRGLASFKRANKEEGVVEIINGENAKLMKIVEKGLCIENMANWIAVVGWKDQVLEDALSMLLFFWIVSMAPSVQIFDLFLATE